MKGIGSHIYNMALCKNDWIHCLFSLRYRRCISHNLSVLFDESQFSRMCLNVISSHPTTKSKNCILTVTFHNLTVAKVAKLRLMAKWWKLVQVYALVNQTNVLINENIDAQNWFFCLLEKLCTRFDRSNLEYMHTVCCDNIFKCQKWKGE